MCKVVLNLSNDLLCTQSHIFFQQEKLTYAEEQGMKDLTKFYPLDTTL